ncbi:MAG: hypothetical protein ACO3JL_20245, partial [Myxococcota bacterium]
APPPAAGAAFRLALADLHAVAVPSGLVGDVFSMPGPRHQLHVLDHSDEVSQCLRGTTNALRM